MATQPAVSGAVPAEAMTDKPVTDKPLSRRALRHRAGVEAVRQVGAMRQVERISEQAIERVPEAISEQAEPSLIEFFQLREGQPTEAQPTQERSTREQPIQDTRAEAVLVVPGSRRAARRAAASEEVPVAEPSAIAVGVAAVSVAAVGVAAVDTAAVDTGAVDTGAVDTPAVSTESPFAGLAAPATSSSRKRNPLSTAARKASPRPVKAPRGRASRTRSRGRSGRRRTLFSKLFSIGAMIGVGALMVSTSLPANAFFSAADAAGAPVKSFTSHAQSLEVGSSAVEAASARDSYTVSSLAAQLRLKYGNQIFSYTNDINGTIQWPFPVPVPISSGFGPRIAPCGGCSSFHEGIDFIPGRGVAIGAIADGVVSQVVASHAGLGNHVVIDHVINGQNVQSVYAHMLDNSFQVTVGETVKVAQTLGLVGSTGESTGPHLHFEIHINGVPVDPFAWLKANAN